MKNYKFLLKFFISLAGISSLLLILFSSALNIYSKRDQLKSYIRRVNIDDHDEHSERFAVNPLKMSNRQLPQSNLQKLKINSNADEVGQWSAPIDWNVTAIHSILLPDYSVMTFGTFGLLDKDKKDPRENKNITITDGRTLKRDDGFHQWEGHDVNSGVDFDIWDFKKGFGDESHELFNKPIVMDAFCSAVRVLDDERVLIVGGNKNVHTKIPDTQAGTMIYNLKNKIFEKSKNLNYKRWYGSLVRTGDDKLIIIGGTDHVAKKPSYIPEILDLKNLNDGWKVLEKAGSKNLFGEPVLKPKKNKEWFYPRSYLTSDGNIVGISYNKIWMMDKNDDYRVKQTNEISLETSGVSGLLVDKNPNHKSHDHNSEKLRLLTIGSPVGKTNSTVMIGKDIVYVFGGKQTGDEFSSSNKVLKIDFSDSSNPKVSKAKNMLMARADSNATILPTGNIFINGGYSYKELKFSVFNGEIYNPNNEISKLMSKGYFRRNYHATSLLLPNGSILVSGGDVWNSEIFYPPYLFTKNWENKTVLAKRPIIKNLEKIIERGNITIELDNNYPLDIGDFTIISAGSTTHAQSSEPKFRKLNYKKISKNKFLLDIPENVNELQNGVYMIFAISKSGTPSPGKIITLK